VGGSPDAGSSPDGPTTTCPTGFDDTFSDSQLGPCWSIYNGAGPNPIVDVSVAAGALHIQAIDGQGGLWYHGGHGALVYKMLTAESFIVTTTVHPRKRSDPTLTPADPPYHGLGQGGVMARDPASPTIGETYVFIMMGASEDDPPRRSVEVKTTAQGLTTDFHFPDWATPDAQVRMCRIGSNFYLYARDTATASPWMLMMTYARPDLPATLQVGPSVNFNADNDLDVAYDDITLSPTVPASVADCTAD
jgi:hypothetical protein